MRPDLIPMDFIRAARVPLMVEPQRFGLWIIERCKPNLMLERAGLMHVGFPHYTLLRRITMRTLHKDPDGHEVVMEDSLRELRRHLPIWMTARGRVLVTGLGLGCVVRGLLASPAVEHIDVVEIDSNILRVIGAEFRGNPRVTLHHADALTCPFAPDARWDFAWHDLWFEDENLQREHLRLMNRLAGKVDRQGAWGFPRWVKRMWPARRLGALLG